MALTDASFDASSRAIIYKLDIYFNGIANEPLTVTKDNYLMSTALLEETTADGDIPFGQITANEIDVELLNEHGIFCPTNAESPYYGKITKGVPINAFISVEGEEWISLGAFYVTDWTATITGSVANITAADKLHTVFGLPDAKPNVTFNVSFAAAFADIFMSLNVPAAIDSALSERLLCAYYNKSNKDLLSALSIGACADCYCGRDGVPVVKPVWGTRPLRATLTDYTQIISANTNQSTQTDYDGVSVTYYVPQETNGLELLRIKDYVAPVGAIDYPVTTLDITPASHIHYLKVSGNAYVYIPSFTATSDTISFKLINTSAGPGRVDISAYGTSLDSTKYTIADTGEYPLSVDSDYIQSEVYASRVKAFLEAYASSGLPMLEVTVRGNPLLLLGDKVRVVSTKYKLDFTGIIIRNNLRYDGSLSGTLTLVDAAVLEGVL